MGRRCRTSYEAFYFVVDLHAITVEQDPKVLRAAHPRRRRAAARRWASTPSARTLFVQRHVPAHAQLAWVLECLTGFGEASRMTQFKDKSAKGGADRATVGLFTYPILQAADILLYQADRRAGRRGPAPAPRADPRPRRSGSTAATATTFRCPEPYILKETAKIYDLQDPTAKMSKSASSPAGIIELLDDPTGHRRRRSARRSPTPSAEMRFDRRTSPASPTC